MSKLEEFYASVGSNASDVIGRLGGSEALVKRFLGKFPNDESFSLLEKSLNENDTETAFRAAHTLKGLAANLGIKSLYAKAVDVTEHLRGGDLESGKKDFPALKDEYEAVLAKLADLD
jgi:histidine phosphotransfer protein HptB